jgi:predicted ATPase with chaperone activity
MRASVDSGPRLRDLKMISPPGSGKTMLAKRLPTILTIHATA